MKKYFGSLFLLVAVSLVNAAGAKSLKKGDIYRVLNGRDAIEVISSSELEITAEGITGENTLLAEYDFKGDKLRVVANVLGTKMVTYYLLTNEGLEDEKTGEVYYSGAALKKAKFKEAAELKKAELKKAAELKKLISTNGTEVTDPKTGLIWRRCSEGMNWDGASCAGVASRFNHEEALLQAAAQASSTGMAWRLPDVEELESLFNWIESGIDPIVFPDTPADAFWSASPYVGYSGLAWSVYFGNGNVHFSLRSFSYYVRLVRAGQ
ncbi:MAG: DUF1566 domain-containing protein [Gammaproteobacteria bacterium]|nr:DUF1566 domain-containing protein [Gammaproteobacteria bacterium]